MLPLFAFVQEIRCLRLMLLFLLFYQYKEICDSYQYNVMINSWTQLKNCQQSLIVQKVQRHHVYHHYHASTKQKCLKSIQTSMKCVFSHNERVEGVDCLSCTKNIYIQSCHKSQSPHKISSNIVESGESSIKEKLLVIQVLMGPRKIIYKIPGA